MENTNDIKFEIELLNNIIKESIEHGGDSGGAYFSNTESLLFSIQQWLNYRNLDNYMIVSRICKSPTGEEIYPRIVRKDKVKILTIHESEIMISCRNCGKPEYYKYWRELGNNNLCRDCYETEYKNLYGVYSKNTYDKGRPTMEEYTKQLEQFEECEYMNFIR